MDALFVFVGRDSWYRPVYAWEGRYYVDTDPRAHQQPRLFTKYQNAFDGEPNNPIPDSIKVTFSPTRDTWR